MLICPEHDTKLLQLSSCSYNNEKELPMNFSNLKMNSHEREKLEKAALGVICACYYYNLADNIDSMSDDELRELIDSDSPDECSDCS